MAANAADWFQPPAGAPAASTMEPISHISGITSGVAASVAQNLFATGKQQADTWFGGWFNIERFKPYFDVDGKLVLQRCAYSLLPRTSASRDSVDLYGPCVIVFSLVVLLHYDFWTHGQLILLQSSHLSSSFALALTFWMLASLVQLLFCWLSSTELSLLQIAAHTGYAFFSVCIAVLASFVLNSIPLNVGLSFLSALSLATTFYGANSSQVKGISMAAGVFVVQFALNFYLAYDPIRYSTGG